MKAKTVSKKGIAMRLPKIENIKLEHVGKIRHVVVGANLFERIIAGERIPDMERHSYNRLYEEDGIHLEPQEDAFSGSMGFIDFREIRYSELESIYMAFMGAEPQYRGQHVGKALVKAVERIAVERGAKITWGYIETWRFKKIFPLLEKMGYHVGNEMSSSFLISKYL